MGAATRTDRVAHFCQLSAQAPKNSSTNSLAYNVIKNKVYPRHLAAGCGNSPGDGKLTGIFLDTIWRLLSAALEGRLCTGKPASTWRCATAGDLTFALAKYYSAGMAMVLIFTTIAFAPCAAAKFGGAASRRMTLSGSRPTAADSLARRPAFHA